MADGRTVSAFNGSRTRKSDVGRVFRPGVTRGWDEPRGRPSIRAAAGYQPSTWAKISGATIVASDSMTNFGVPGASFSHVIFSFGVAPEYDP